MSTPGPYGTDPAPDRDGSTHPPEPWRDRAPGDAPGPAEPAGGSVPVAGSVPVTGSAPVTGSVAVPPGFAGYGYDAAGMAGPPAAPPGPGVRPPFAAPPTDRDRRRLWIGLTIGAVVMALCCGGGIFGLGAVVVTGINQERADARSVVSAYLNAQRGQNWDTAYSYLCRSARNRETPGQFASRMAAMPQVTSFTLGPTRIGNDIVQEATVNRGGTESVVRYTLVQEGSPSALKICAGTE